MQTSTKRLAAVAIAAVTAAGLTALPAGAAKKAAAKPAAIKIGLITKTETNPFFVKMKEGAAAKAKELGATLISASGKADDDNASQVAAFENMVAAGVKTILLTASDSKAIVASVKKAQAKGVQVIALDSPLVPDNASDALFATNNYVAGQLIGKYAKAALAGKAPKIVALDLFPGHPVGAQRHNGFADGMGLKTLPATSNDLSTDGIGCAADSFGDTAKGQTGMENCLSKVPDVNVVYTINEPAALGAYQALKAAGKEKDVIIVSVDGGCAGVKNVQAGIIAATSQQYPLLLASLDVEAGVAYAKSGYKTKVKAGYTDTGVNLIVGKTVAGFTDGKDVAFGVAKCWG
jgi:fructose transport system substrate-binding protein